MSKNLKLFTVGIGTEKGSKILNRDGSYKKDNKGIEVVSRLDSKSLQETAENTGGKYFEISDNTNQVEELISEIKNIKGDIGAKKILEINPKFIQAHISISKINNYSDTELKKLIQKYFFLKYNFYNICLLFL